MSASIKKKLRKEQEAVTLTEKQLKEKAEAKKLKTYTITFVVIMALVLCIAVGTVAYTSIAKTGIFHRSIVAATVGEHKLSAADLNYYYFDNISLAAANCFSVTEIPPIIRAISATRSSPLISRIELSVRPSASFF